MHTEAKAKVNDFVFNAVCMAFCGVVSVYFLVRSILFASYPYFLEYGEGICVHMAQLLRQGNLYKPLTTLPLIVANYPPVYFLLNWFAFPSNVFLVGRCISMLATLGIGIMIFLILRQHCRKSSIGFIGATIFFMYPWLNQSGMLYRVDMLAAFLSILGFYLFFSNIRKAHLWAGVFFLLALYTKHSFWAAPFAAYISLIISDRKRGLKELLLFLGSGAAVFLVITLITHGWFFKHLVLYNAYTYIVDQLLGSLKLFAKDTGIIWIPFIPGLFVCYKRCRHFLLYGLLAFIWLGSVGREGASAHYFFESIIAVSLISAMGTSYLIETCSIKSIRTFIVILLLGTHLYMNQSLFSPWAMDDTRKQILSFLHDQIAQDKGKILAEDSGILVMSGKTVYVHTFAISKLIDQGLMEPDAFYDLIATRQFSRVVLNSSLEKLSYETYHRFTKTSLKLIYHNYDFDKQIGRNFIYRRKER